MVKKLLLPFAAIVIGFIINIWLGLAITAVLLIYTVYTKLPNFYAIYANKLFSENDSQGAIKWYKRAIKTGRASDNLKLAYSMLLLRTGFPKDAQAQLDLLASSKTVTPQIKSQAKQYRCLAYYKQGRMDEAMEDAKELFSEMKNTITYGIMGLFMLLTDAPIDETVELCEEACDYNSDDRDILDNMALAYYRAGRYEEAKECTDRLTGEHTQFVEAFYHGALVEVALGNREKAKEYLSKIPDCRMTYMTTVSQREIDALAAELNGGV